jgi:hypothetical protein
VKCQRCGTENPEAVEFCAKCGNRIAEAQQQAMRPPAKSGMSVPRKVVVVVLAIVLITAALSVVYIFVMGYGTTCIGTPGIAFENSTMTNGVRMTVVSITMYGLSWSDVRVWLFDGAASVEWEPEKDDLDGNLPVSVNLTSDGPASLGGLNIYCWVFDATGDGFVNNSDYVEVFTGGGAVGFSASTEYTLALIYELSGDQMTRGLRFTG